jgi:hypothetical protein
MGTRTARWTISYVIANKWVRLDPAFTQVQCFATILNGMGIIDPHKWILRNSDTFLTDPTDCSFRMRPLHRELVSDLPLGGPHPLDLVQILVVLMGLVAGMEV